MIPRTALNRAPRDNWKGVGIGERDEGRIRRFIPHLLILALCFTGTDAAYARAKFAGEFLHLGSGARALGMGGAFVAVSDDATAGTWNPAGLTRIRGREVHAQHAELFGGLVAHDQVNFGTTVQDVGSVGFSLLRVGVDNIPITVLEDPNRPIGSDNRPVRVGDVSSADYAVHLSYAHPIRKLFAIGGSVKLIRRKTGSGTGFGYGLDLGFLGEVTPGLTVGLVVRDLTESRITYSSAATDKINPTALIGAAYTYHPTFVKGRIMGSFSASIGRDAVSIEDGRRFNFGIEYSYRELVSLRLGAQERRFTAGGGVRFYRRFGVDLAFLSHGDLNNSYRVSATAQF